MKKSRRPQEMTRLNGAAFRLGADAVRGGGLEKLLEETLAQVFGGTSFDETSCTTFNCNMYAPQPVKTPG